MQQAPRNGDVVARHAIQVAETALGLPRLFQNDGRLVAYAAGAFTAAFDNHANGASIRWRSEKLDRYVTAARKIAMKQSVSGTSFSRTGISRHRVLLHNASELLALKGSAVVPVAQIASRVPHEKGALRVTRVVRRCNCRRDQGALVTSEACGPF